MKFKIDENLAGQFLNLLTHSGFSADTVVQENLKVADDSVVANICQKESRILLTLDLDFAAFNPISAAQKNRSTL